MTAELSPAAQAIWDAFNEDEAGVFVDFGDKLAAALLALEDRLAQDRPEPLPPDLGRAVITERIRLFRRITAIAAELGDLHD